MDLVINIPEEDFEIMKHNVAVDNPLCPLNQKDMVTIIANGTPLPKGHGRLIDGDKFLKDNEAYTGWILDSSDWGGENAYKDTLEDLVNDADTIIEADKVEE